MISSSHSFGLWIFEITKLQVYLQQDFKFLVFNRWLKLLKSQMAKSERRQHKIRIFVWLQGEGTKGETFCKFYFSSKIPTGVCKETLPLFHNYCIILNLLKFWKVKKVCQVQIFEKFWRVLKKRYINLSPISDQISSAFEGQTTSIEVKKILLKVTVFLTDEVTRNFLVMCSSIIWIFSH